MDKNISQKTWASEFIEFLESEPVQAPQVISENIHKEVARSLHLPLWQILLKVGTIQTVVALATLLVCPQFEIDFVVMGHNDAHLKALLGETAYMGLCGTIFLGSGTLLASLLLKVEELRAIKKTQYPYIFLVSVFALLIFYKFGVPSRTADYAAWFTGAFLGSIAVFEMIKGVKIFRYYS